MNEKNPVALVISEIEGVGSESFVVAGRCSEGPIKTGDVFTAVYRLEITTLGAPPRCVSPVSVSLQVREIVIYGTKFDALEKGLSARLTLEGSGRTALNTGMLLCS